MEGEVLRFANSRGWGPVEFIHEQVSGTKRWRDRKIGAMIESLKEGDVLILPELSRAGRSMLEIMEVLSVLKDKGVAIYDLKNGYSLDGSLQSKVLAMAFSIAAEIERDLISKRTKEALAVRKSSGVVLGRPKGPSTSKLDKHLPAILADLRQGVPKTVIAKKYGTSESNLHFYLKARSIETQPVAGDGSDS